MAKERGESPSGVWAHLQSQEKLAVWLMGSSACVELALPAPASGLHSSLAATTPGTCHSRGLEMELGRDQGMRLLPVVQQRPRLRSVPLDSFPALHFVAVRGSRAGRRLPPSCSFLLLLLPGLLSCGALSCSLPGPYLPLPVELFPLLFLPQGSGRFSPSPGTRLRGPPSAGNRDPRGSPAAGSRGRAATPPLIG